MGPQFTGSSIAEQVVAVGPVPYRTIIGKPAVSDKPTSQVREVDTPFSQISKNWAGEPLVSLEKMLNFLRTTRTEVGLRVRATLMTGHYPKAIKPTAAQMASLPLLPHNILPDWNYTISSSANH